MPNLKHGYPKTDATGPHLYIAYFLNKLKYMSNTSCGMHNGDDYVEVGSTQKQEVPEGLLFLLLHWVHVCFVQKLDGN